MWGELVPFAAPGGAVATLFAVAWMVYTDRLIPYRSHRERLADKQAEITRLTAALDKVEKQRDHLLELAQVTVGIVQALPKAKDPVQ